MTQQRRKMQERCNKEKRCKEDATKKEIRSRAVTEPSEGRQEYTEHKPKEQKYSAQPPYGFCLITKRGINH